MQSGGGPSFRERHPLGTTAFEFLQISCVRVVFKRLPLSTPPPVSAPAIILEFSLYYECFFICSCSSLFLFQPYSNVVTWCLLACLQDVVMGIFSYSHEVLDWNDIRSQVLECGLSDAPFQALAMGTACKPTLSYERQDLLLLSFLPPSCNWFSSVS